MTGEGVALPERLGLFLPPLGGEVQDGGSPRPVAHHKPAALVGAPRKAPTSAAGPGRAAPEPPLQSPGLGEPQPGAPSLALPYDGVGSIFARAASVYSFPRHGGRAGWGLWGLAPPEIFRQFF